MFFFLLKIHQLISLHMRCINCVLHKNHNKTEITLSVLNIFKV